MNQKFISLEGIEGSGKSTLMPFVIERCEIYAKGRNVIATREPGGTPCAEAIRDIFLKSFEEKIYPETEALLVYASRMQHIQEKILPHLKQGDLVVCDRFFDASMAYQGGGEKLPMSFMNALNDMIVKDVVPDLTLLLDVPVELAFQRIDSRDAKDRMELKSADFFERIRQSYLDLAEKSVNRIKVIDGSQSIKAVQEAIDQHLLEFFK